MFIKLIGPVFAKSPLKSYFFPAHFHFFPFCRHEAFPASHPNLPLRGVKSQ